jgi:hypothetical protein
VFAGRFEDTNRMLAPPAQFELTRSTPSVFSGDKSHDGYHAKKDRREQNGHHDWWAGVARPNHAWREYKEQCGERCHHRPSGQQTSNSIFWFLL